MSDADRTARVHGAPPPPHTEAGDQPSTGDLVSSLAQDVSRLVRDELHLARAEVTSKARGAGKGVGMLGAAGILALYGGAVLIATVILALTLVMDAWLAAAIVAVLLFAVAGVAALMGRKRVQEAGPPVPERAVASVKEDVDAVRNPSAHH